MSLAHSIDSASRSLERQKDIIGEKETAEHRSSLEEQEAAFLDIFGNWKAFIGKEGGTMNVIDEVGVRPITSKDISWIAGAVKLVVEHRESKVAENLPKGGASEQQIVQNIGEPARQAVLETSFSVRGELEFLNKLYDAIYSGILSKTPEIFVLEPQQAGKYIINRHQTELKGEQLNRSPIHTDPTNIGTEYCFVVTPHKGGEIEKLFKENQHRVIALSTCEGFQTELGGVRMAFLYNVQPAEHIPKKDTTGKESNVAVKSAESLSN